MKRVLIIHGWGGSDYPHWQAWLASELIKKNYCVSFPELPNKDLPKLDVWLDYIKTEVEHFNPDIVVCHSLGNILWFHLVNKYEINEIQKLMLVAPVRRTCEIEELKTFFPYSYPKDLRAKEVMSAVSDNDPYMNIDEAFELQKELNIGMKIMENAGHINANSGFGELSCALEWIMREDECEENKS